MDLLWGFHDSLSSGMRSRTRRVVFASISSSITSESAIAMVASYWLQNVLESLSFFDPGIKRRKNLASPAFKRASLPMHFHRSTPRQVAQLVFINGFAAR